MLSETKSRFAGKTLYLTLFTFLFLVSMAQAQVFTGNLQLTSQAEVDAFNYTEVTGYLLIEGDNITSLQSLSTLTSVGGDLSIDFNPSLTNLDGLSSLTSVGDVLSIQFNPSLTNLDGLSSLTSVGGPVGGQLNITHNSSLQNLDGLSSLTSVASSLAIESNPALTNLDGLSNLTSVGGILDIFNNPSLTNLDGLSNLTFVGGLLIIEFNLSLTEFCGLFALLYGGGLTGSYNVSDNAENPSAFEIVAEGPCFITPQYIPYALVKAIGDVQNLPLNAGNKNALLSKLNNAIAKYNAGDLNAAKNLLNAFINQINSFVANGTLTSADALPVIDYVHEIIDAINSSLPKAENESNEQLPEEFTLHQNYPNPFNPSTVIDYRLPVGGHVSLKIYDILGSEVVTLVNEFREAGYYQIHFNGSELASGMYIYRITAGNFVSTKKMLMIK